MGSSSFVGLVPVGFQRRQYSSERREAWEEENERGKALVMQDACLLHATPWSLGAGLCTGHRDSPCGVLPPWDRS